MTTIGDLDLDTKVKNGMEEDGVGSNVIPDTAEGSDKVEYKPDAADPGKEVAC